MAACDLIMDILILLLKPSRQLWKFYLVVTLFMLVSSQESTENDEFCDRLTYVESISDVAELSDGRLMICTGTVLLHGCDGACSGQVRSSVRLKERVNMYMYLVYVYAYFKGTK